MGLPVISFTASTGGRDRLDWTDEDYNGLFVTKALRRKSFSGRCVVRINGQPVGVRSAEREVALRWFAHVAHAYLFANEIETPIALVPVPNADALDLKASCDTSEQAAALAASIGKNAYVLDCVRWKSPIAPDRDARHYLEQTAVYPITLTRAAPQTTALVDEVFTDGATLRAVCARLREHGINVDLALCAAFSPASRVREVFKAHRQVIDLGI